MAQASKKANVWVRNLPGSMKKYVSGLLSNLSVFETLALLDDSREGIVFSQVGHCEQATFNKKLE